MHFVSTLIACGASSSAPLLRLSDGKAHPPGFRHDLVVKGVRDERRDVAGGGVGAAVIDLLACAGEAKDPVALEPASNDLL